MKMNMDDTKSTETNTITFTKEDFSRMDETDDELFYSRDRFVDHLDSLALSTVEKIIGDLIVEENPVILDLMAGWDSHIPERVKASKVIGLGLNEHELAKNKHLTEFVVHDLNDDPRMPFPDDTFDAVINTVSVDYMTGPVEVFGEVARILKPGGLFLVIFSNRMFPQKAVKIWRESTEDEREMLVEDFFKTTAQFEERKTFLSKGKPRPQRDKYSHMGIPSDPVYAVYANKKGGKNIERVIGNESEKGDYEMDEDTIAKRKEAVKHTLECPYCGQKMKKWAVPQTPFTTWENEYMYVCFNDACPYFVRGWDTMNKQGNRGFSYRCMFDPIREKCHPIPVPTVNALKEGIVEQIDYIKETCKRLDRQIG